MSTAVPPTTSVLGSVRKAMSAPAIADLRQAWQMLHVIAFLAASDLRARYRRSVLGPFWMTLGTAAGTLGLGLVWSELLHMDRANFVPSLTAGLIIWYLLSATMIEATTTYWRQAALIRNLSMPLSMPPIQTVLKHLINFAHNLPVLVVVGLMFAVPLTRHTLLVLPCLLLVLANLLWISLLLGMLGARFRDLEYVLVAAMPVLMFLSPVFYRPDYLPFSAHFIWFNPFSHLIELIRYPLLGTAPPGFVVLTNALMCLGGWIATLWLFNAKRNRIAYWL